jgi:cytochrome subunit of sulfide dehydrogenase
MLRPLAFALVAGALSATAGAGPNLGRDIAANCTSCHAVDGKNAGGIPGLAGRSSVYIVERMKEFRAGTRPSTVMQQLAKGYTDAEIEAAAAYLAAQKAN